MKNVTFTLVIFVVAISFGIYFFLPKKAPAVLGQVGPFSLTDAQNREFNENNVKDKIWIVDFIFTSCQGPCPLMTQRLAALQQEFKDNPTLNILTVTVDPERDSPDVLNQYAQQYQADQSSWHFLTGERERIRALMMDELKLGFADDIIFHSDRLVLVDKKARIRGYYVGSERDSFKKLKRDLTTLLSHD